MTPSLGVVIVNYNTGPALAACLGSLRAHLPDVANTAVIVVDNASHDASLDVALEALPGVRTLRLPENVGFATGVNRGAAAITGDYLLMLNPDCRLQAGVVEALQETLTTVADCGVVGPLVLDDDGSVQGSARRDPSLLTGLFGRTSMWTRVFPNSRLARTQIVWPNAESGSRFGEEVDWVSGACMLVRRDLFDMLGGFDEGYFLYWEDADLCRRARQRGWRVRYVTRASVFHSVGTSSRGAQDLAIRAFHASALRYSNRWIAPRSLSARRLLTRGLIAARGWWKLRQAARPALPIPGAATHSGSMGDGRPTR